MKIAIALAALMLLSAMAEGVSSNAAGASGTAMRGPIRLPWYNQPGDPLGCPGAGPYKRWKRVVAVRPSDPRFKCGDIIELRYGKQTVRATVADSFSEYAPAWVVFDAAARLNCDLLLPKHRRSRKPMGYAKDCATLSNVYWRKVGQRD